MKKTILFVAIATLAAQAFATGSGVPPVVGTIKITGSGANQVTSSSGAGSYVNGAGSSLSKAANVQTATAYVGGSGSLSSSPTNKFVSIADCAPATKVSGTELKGNVTSFGGTSVYGLSTASNVSTGAGTGGAASSGLSVAEVAGKTTATAPNFNLSAEGSAFSGALTGTTAGTNQVGPKSEGATSSSYVANATGNLFTFKSGNTIGDVKTVTTNVVTRAGDLTCPGGKCTPSTTIPSIANNATVEAGANGNAFADIKATFTKP